MDDNKPNKNVARKTVFSFVSEGSSVFLFVFGMFVARSVGPAEFGEFTYALAYCGLFALALDLGFINLVTRELSSSPQKGHTVLQCGLGLQIIASPLIVFLILASFLVLAPSATTMIIVLAASAAVVCRVIKSTLRGTLRGTGRFGIEATSMMIERVSLFVLGGAVLFGDWTITEIIICFAAIKVIDLTLLAIVVHLRVMSLVPRIRLDELRKLAGALLPFAVTTACWALYNFTDTLMLGYFRGSYDVGQYGAIYQLFEGMIVVPSIIGAVFLPLMAYEHRKGKLGVQKATQQGIRLLIVAAVPVFVVCLIAPKEILYLLYGAEFVAAATGMTLLLGAAPFVFVFWFLRGTLIAINRTKSLAILSGAGVCFNIATNFFAIPLYGLAGACLTTLITEFVTFAGALIILKRVGIDGPGLKPWLQGLVAASVLSVFLLVFARETGWALLGVPLGLIGAYLSLCIIGFWTVDERGFLRRLHLCW